MTIALIDLSPELSYTSVPRLSPHSFLQAKAKNTSHYAMLAGPSNIFLDNNFIAKVHQHMVHFGRNKGQVERAGEDSTKQSLLMAHSLASDLIKTGYGFVW